MSGFKRQAELLLWHAYYDGWLFTLFRCLVKSTEVGGLNGTRAEWFQRLSERQYDRRFCVSTRGNVATEDLDVPDDRRKHAVEYLPTHASSIGWLLSTLPIELSEFTFVDCGAGKGRVLLVASEFPFRKVIGVELAHQLHMIASQNITNFQSPRRQCEDVRSVNMDAADFEFPSEPLIVFLYNPFSEEITKLVVDNLMNSLDVNPRPVVVLYHNPVYTNLFEESSIFQENYADCRPGQNWKIYSLKPVMNPITN